MGMSEFEIKYKEWHTKLSFVKSGLRIATSAVVALGGYITGADQFLIIFAIGFGVAEVIGIVEEF